jgi:hypothetical protein
VLATTRLPTIEAKMSIRPLMICGMARQVISRFDLLENWNRSQHQSAQYLLDDCTPALDSRCGSSRQKLDFLEILGSTTYVCPAWAR